MVQVAMMALAKLQHMEVAIAEKSSAHGNASAEYRHAEVKGDVLPYGSYYGLMHGSLPRNGRIAPQAQAVGRIFGMGIYATRRAFSASLGPGESGSPCAGMGRRVWSPSYEYRSSPQ